MGIPLGLEGALRPVTVVVGHYGAGKTNFCVNLAIDLAGEGAQVTLVDLDVVNPYFRASEQRRVLEAHGVAVAAPVFAEAGSSLDVPSLTGAVAGAIERAGEGRFAIVDAGGDDAGATALGRFAGPIAQRGYAMLYVANRFRNLVADPACALANLREIEAASHLQVTAIVNNSHLKADTAPESIALGIEYADRLSALSGLPVACTTVPQNLHDESAYKGYPVQGYVKAPWE